MTPAPHTVGFDQPLTRAYKMMRDHGLRHLPVLDAGKIVGVLSQRDLYLVEAGVSVDRSVERVTEAMASDVYTVAPGDQVSEVARVMAEHKYGCAIVVDMNRVVGIFTATDALALLSRAKS